jgi:hypothetical protein
MGMLGQLLGQQEQKPQGTWTFLNNFGQIGDV